ncbi:alpha/beta fold hydrolase [Paucisalibacillus sp. EB02]|uniref:alpha/beta fold hydrolase n=1 Tax=Paucisalibacillus sp. EB02 TaxID=1347087 RepID=UPI0004B28550|nr:alpha/beta hydrolase [Paucisalibacillus sp. EB02]
MEFLVKQIELNKHTFQYRESGNPLALPIVALHSLGNNSKSWERVAAGLGESYRFIALDQRGHGESARTDTYSFEEMCEDLLLFVDALDLERFILIGHSMGGTVSYLFSEQYASRIEKLVVVDTPPPFTDKPKEIPSEPEQPLPFDWKAFQSIMRQLNEPNPEWWERLPAISAPTLIIGGGASNIPQDKLREVSENIPDCKLVTIDGAGHHVHQDNLSEFLSILIEFLK